MPKQYPAEIRERAVRLVREAQQHPDTSYGAPARIAQQLGINADTLRGWLKQADIDGGARPGVTTSESARIAELERENRELKRANQILKSASVDSTGQRNSVSSLSAGVSKFSVFLGREFNRAATLLRSSWVRSFILTPLGKY